MKIGFIALVFMLLLSHLARADQFSHLDGVYDMQIKIGETTFNDVLELVTVSSDRFNAKLSGFVTVPNAFKAALTGTAEFHSAWGYSFDFTILARENGQEFKVHYRGGISSGISTILQGAAYFEDGKVLGNFTAVKRK